MRTFLALIFVLSYSSTYANTGIDTVDMRSLSSSSTWMKLVHYKKDDSSATGVLSDIHSKRFFLSIDGRTNPYAELLATVKAFSSQGVLDTPIHARCQFPARFLWLSRQLPERFNQIAPVECPNFKKWSLNGNVKSISIVYATGFLGNPASFYGHTLLKLNSSDKGKEKSLVDGTINFGAIVEEDDDPLTYIVKGLSGGYDGGFSHIDYYFHTHNYGENELRDLWEYELDLPQSDVDLIVAHGWELLGQKYTYYFLKENCSLRMAELIQLADGVDIIPDNPAWTIPQALMKKLHRSSFYGQPLVKKIHKLPSRQTQFYDDFVDLSSKEKQWVDVIAGDIKQLQGIAFGQIAQQSQLKIMNALVDYYQYLIKKYPEEEKKYQQLYYQVLSQRFLLPKGTVEVDTSIEGAPHTGRKPSYTSITMVNTDKGNRFDLRIRPAYYDELDADFTHIKSAALSMMDVTLSITDQEIELRKFDLISLRSMNSKATGLPGDQRDIWRLNAGLVNEDTECSDNCSQFRVSADMGYSYFLSPNWLGALYVGGAIQENKHQSGQGYTQVSFALFGKFSAKLNSQLEYNYRRYVNGKQDEQNITRAWLRYQIGENLDSRLYLKHQQGYEMGLSFGVYW